MIELASQISGAVSTKVPSRPSKTRSTARISPACPARAAPLDVALGLLEWLDTEKPGQMDTMKMIFLCHVQSNKHEQAIHTLDRMLECSPGCGWAEAAKERLEQLPGGSLTSG